ncbi:MAG: sterol desaturase family protein [Pseudomonadota bacterium]
MSLFSFFALIIAFVFVMEGVAWVMHKYLMHGVLWSVHKTHHEPRTGPFEFNDIFGVVFALPSVALIYYGYRYSDPMLAAGIGILLYGVIYFFFHDILVHERINIGLRPKKGYLARVRQAHHLHHAVKSKDGCVSFGFIFAPSPQRLKQMLKATQVAELRRSKRASCESA